MFDTQDITNSSMRTMTATEFKAFSKLFIEKSEEIEEMRKFMKLSGFKDDELIFIWDWTERDIQIVPIFCIADKTNDSNK